MLHLISRQFLNKGQLTGFTTNNDKQMGGFMNIKPNEGVQFSSENQPKNRRGSAKFLSEMLTKNLKTKTEIIVEGRDITTNLLTKVKVTMPTVGVIINALLKQAAKGNMQAVNIIFDRIEGKTMLPLELGGVNGKDLHPHTITFLPASSLTDEQLEKYVIDGQLVSNVGRNAGIGYQ